MTLMEQVMELFKAKKPKDDEMLPWKSFHGKLDEALKVYGDGAGLAADHPLHALKALHKEMGDYIAAGCSTAKSEEPPVPETPSVVEEPVVETPVVVEEPVVETPEVAKAEDVEKADLKKRLAETEEVLKAEREASALKDMITTLKSFSMISINPEVDAPIFKSLKDTNAPTFDRLMEILKGADASVDLTKTIGSDLPGDKTSGNTAWARIEVEAEPLTKGENAVTKAQAIDIVMKRRPDLVKQHYAEQGA